jgi:hypothetical protein
MAGQLLVTGKEVEKILRWLCNFFYIRILKSCYMVKLGQLQSGDIVMVNDDGLMREGMVVQTNGEEQMALIDNGIQEFWYAPQDIFPVALNEDQLMKFGFEKVPIDGNGAKYKKGVFRLVTPVAGDFTKLDMWYREDNRHFHIPIAVHELQNLHSQMTKVPLERP